MEAFLKQLFVLIIYGGIIQGIFIVLLLNNGAVKKGRANFFLSILLLAMSFSIAHMLFAGAVIDHLSAKVYSIGDPTFYLIAPLLWFYAAELTGQTIKWSWRLLLHFAPFFLIIILSLALRSVDSIDFNHFLVRHHHLVKVFFWIIIVIQCSWYQVLVRKRWIGYKTFVQQEVSNTEHVSISWIRFYMSVFLIINLLFLFSLFSAIHLLNQTWLPKATAVIFSLSVFALGYKGILQREVFRKEEEIPADKPHLDASAKDKPNAGRVEQLLLYMKEQRPYLNPELTLTELAKGLNMTRSQLSALINEGTGDNFYDFVNKYRVEQVKKLIIDPEMKNFNMLGLALEAGFKSKSTFNLIFKRFTGLTPSEYRKNQLP